jgi:hypothetical protein
MIRIEVLFPVIVSALYLGTAIAYAHKNQPAIGAMWLAYAVANVCLVIAHWDK